MIGIFDSGRGGYYTMQEIRKLLPEYDYLFYGDIAHMPYGDKTPALRYGYQGYLDIKPCAWFADLVEQDMKSSFTEDKKRDIIRQYVGEQWPNAESIVLACTHYGVWYDSFRDLYPDTLIIDPSQETAKKTVEYLHRHPELEQKLTRGGEVREYWTK